MLRFLKSSSVHHIPEESLSENTPEKHSSGGGDVSEACTSFTVWRKSLVFGCSGFTVIGSDGSLVYRVDNYSAGGRPRRVVLMDGSGDPVFTICRHQKLKLLDSSWLLYNGEVGSDSSKNPIFHARKSSSNIFPRTKQDQYILTHVYNSNGKKCSYTIEGSYAHRSCKILDESRCMVAEIKPKPATSGGVCFGSDIFSLVVKSGLEPGLAMSFLLLLDQMFS